MRTRRGIVAVLTTLALVPALAGHATTRRGLVIDDPRGDALWVDPSLNADWADVTQARVASVRNDSGAVTALQFTYVTVKPPRDDDKHRVAFTAAWEVRDSAGPWCTGDFIVRDTRVHGPWGGPHGDLTYSCDGDDEPGEVYLDGKAIRAHVRVLAMPDGTVTPTRRGTALVVTLPLSMFRHGLSNGRYHEGARLIGLRLGSMELWNTSGVLVDVVGGSLVGGGSFNYTIGR
jgi:hypothetical protein